METKTKKKKKSTNKYKGNNVLLVLGIVYTLVTILAIFSYVSRMNTVSTTPVTFASVLSSIWWQLLMIILFAITYVLYSKKQILATLLEIIMGMAMLVYILISALIMGIDIIALMLQLICPFILIFHGLNEFKKVAKNQRTVSTI